MGLSSLLTIPAGKVGADLAGFPVRVDLSDLPSAWWDAAPADLSTLRVHNSHGTEAPFDLVTFDATAHTGVLYCRLAVAAAADTYFSIALVDAATAPMPTDPIGRDAVWAGYEAFWDFSGNDATDRTGNDYVIALGGQTIAGGVMHMNLSTATIDGFPGSTEWTIRAGFDMTSARQGGILSHNTGVRLITDNGNRIGCYYTYWTYPPDYSIGANIWYDATLTGSGSTVWVFSKHGQSKAARSNGGGALTQLKIGSTGGYKEYSQGYLNRLGVTSSVRADAWVKAEYDSWGPAGGFYTVSQPITADLDYQLPTVSIAAARANIDYQLPGIGIELDAYADPIANIDYQLPGIGIELDVDNTLHTDISNGDDVRRRTGWATITDIVVPVVPRPGNIAAGVKYDKAISYEAAP